MVTAAAKAAGIDRTAAYKARQADEEFALAWADVNEANIEKLEAEARKRACDSSDVLLIFLLKAHRPDVYRDRVAIEHSGKVALDGVDVDKALSKAVEDAFADGTPAGMSIEDLAPIDADQG